MRKLTITADDFGIDGPTNRAIVYAFNKGLISGAGIMPTGKKYNEAVELAKKHKIPVGVHVSAIWKALAVLNPPLTGIKSLTDPTMTPTPDEIACEVGTQIYRVWRDGLAPKYWDSHRFTLPGNLYGPMVAEISRSSYLPFVNYGKGPIPKDKSPRIDASGSIMPNGKLSTKSMRMFLGNSARKAGWTWVHISTRGERKKWLGVLDIDLKAQMKEYGVELGVL